MSQIIKVKKLPHEQYTLEGAFYATVNGKNVGEANRAFFHSHAEAKACGERFVANMKPEQQPGNAA